MTRSKNIIEQRSVEMVTLDDIFHQSNSLEFPLLLKIDTEGNELNTLNGALSLLKKTDFVIIEVSIAKRFEESYSFEELIHFMYMNGFYVFSFLSVVHPSKEIRPRFADIIFARCD